MSTQPPTTWRSMPWLSIQASRAARSERGFDTGRVGLPPANAKARLPPFSIRRSEGNRSFAFGMAASRSGGTRWAWESTIIRGFLRQHLPHRHGRASRYERRGLSRPSTSSMCGCAKDVDARHRPGMTSVSELTLSILLILPRGGDKVAEPGELDRRLVDRDPERRKRVVDGAGDRGRCAEIAGLARALLAEHGMRGRGLVMNDLDRRHFVR